MDASNSNSAVPIFFYTFSACVQSQGADASSVQALEASSTGVLLAVRSAALREETLAFQVHLARLQEESTVNVRVRVLHHCGL